MRPRSYSRGLRNRKFYADSMLMLMSSSFRDVACTAIDASVSPNVDTGLLVAPARHSDSDNHEVLSMRAGSDDDLSASSRRAVFIALGVVLGVIFVVILVLGFTCTLKQCQRLRHAGRSTYIYALLHMALVTMLSDPSTSRHF